MQSRQCMGSAGTLCPKLQANGKRRPAPGRACRVRVEYRPFLRSTGAGDVGAAPKVLAEGRTERPRWKTAPGQAHGASADFSRCRIFSGERSLSTKRTNFGHLE